MGCTSLREKDFEPIDKVLDSKMFDLPKNYEELNNIFKEGREIIKELEKYRNILIDKREEIIFETGACTITSPTLETALKCFFWNLAKESSGNVLSYQLYFNEGQDPYFSISNGSQNDTKISELINDYIKEIFSFEPTIQNAKEKYEKFMKDFDENYEKYKKELSSENPEEDPSKSRIMVVFNHNASLLKFIQRNKIVEKLYSVFQEDLSFIKKIGDLLGDNAYIDQVNKVGCEGKKNNYKDQYQLSYQSAPENQRYMESPYESFAKFKDKVYFKKQMKEQE